MLRASGIVGVSLIAKPLAKTFYTLSAWESRESLDSAVGGWPHVDTMQRFRSLTTRSLFAFWTVPPDHARPDWWDAHRRLEAEASSGPRR